MRMYKVDGNRKERIKAEKDKLEIEKVKKIYEMFDNVDRNLQIDEKRKNASLRILQNKVKEKKISLINNKTQILWNQIKYMDKSILMYHLLLFIIILPIMTLMRRSAVDKEGIIITCVILSGVLGIISIFEISHIFFSGIAEISESCYFNVKQIVAFYMSISGIINLTLLSIGILFVSVGWKIELLRVGLYILVPFVFTECCCLGVLLTKVGRKSSYMLVITGIFVIVSELILTSSLKLYETAALIIWGMAFAAGLFILGIQIKILFTGIKKGEIICMN